MSLVTLATGLATKISETTISDILGAFRLQFVGRNSSGAPEKGQDLGTVTYPWGVGHFNSVRIAGEAIDVSNIVSPANRVISGAVRANSEQPQYLGFTVSTDDISVLGATTALELSINASAVSVESDILFETLTVAPSSNNTCLVDDATLTDQLSSKYTGEDGTTLKIGTVGSEITDRIGELVALRKNPAGEIMLAYVKSATELTNIYRGFFYDDGDDPIVRETLADGDQLDLKSLGWIFIGDTGTSGEIIYTNPTYSYDEPSSPTTDDYWFDMTNQIWKRYSGSAFVQIDRTLVGLVVIGLSSTIGYRCIDFFHDYRDTNTIDLEVFSDEIISSKDKTNNVYVYSKTLRVDPTKLTWDNTADMETGSVAASTTYYLYLASTGERKISLEKYYTRNDLLGKYHPYEAWRCIGDGTTDDSSDWSSVSYEGVGILLNQKILYQGEEIFTSSSTFTVPTGVNEISVVCVGGGGGGGNGDASWAAGGGGGGALCYGKIAVSPLEEISVVVGSGGAASAAGGDSYVSTIVGGGGGAGNDSDGGNPVAGASGGTRTGGDGGGDGGSTESFDQVASAPGSYGGGGAGGYSGDGGNGSFSSATSGGGGGGGGGNSGQNGGSVGILIEGDSGAAGGNDGSDLGTTYGGGGRSVSGTTGAAGKAGAVRILWGLREYPNKSY